MSEIRQISREELNEILKEHELWLKGEGEGKRADLVIWSDNPLETYSASIEATYMNGKVIYKKGDVMRCI